MEVFIFHICKPYNNSEGKTLLFLLWSSGEGRQSYECLQKRDQCSWPYVPLPPREGIERNGRVQALGMMCLLVGRDPVHFKGVHKDQWLSGLWGKGLNRRRAGNFQGRETILYNTVKVDPSHYIFVKTRRMNQK